MNENHLDKWMTRATNFMEDLELRVEALESHGGGLKAQLDGLCRDFDSVDPLRSDPTVRTVVPPEAATTREKARKVLDGLSIPASGLPCGPKTYGLMQDETEAILDALEEVGCLLTKDTEKEIFQAGFARGCAEGAGSQPPPAVGEDVVSRVRIALDAGIKNWVFPKDMRDDIITALRPYLHPSPVPSPSIADAYTSGYHRGHNDTVEGGYADPEECGQEYASEHPAPAQSDKVLFPVSEDNCKCEPTEDGSCAACYRREREASSTPLFPVTKSELERGYHNDFGPANQPNPPLHYIRWAYRFICSRFTGRTFEEELERRFPSDGKVCALVGITDTNHPYRWVSATRRHILAALKENTDES